MHGTLGVCDGRSRSAASSASSLSLPVARRSRSGDLAKQPESPESQKLVIRAEFALAREPVLRKRVATMTLNRAGRSVYWAMTELCKGRDPSFTPGRRAVDAVRRGEYLVQPRPEAWNRPE